MTVEERMGSMGGDEGFEDQFPIGMRVLAVDDDPICLKVLETLLLRCQYHVTTTNQAIEALNMLRENKDRFDLVISDVHMPDMDGFKLLELMGLEMDLPVIMLSANGETKAVMKGISHGACDYLIKPVRIEELRNIWQHVVRRRKFDHKDRQSLDNEEDHENNQGGNSEGTQVPGGDRNGKANRKRKDSNDEDEDYFEENTHESEDPSSQKRPRVVWSVELHRKFVAAVNKLGIDKAVPKRILDLMNVEKLTRENVASHLQKYRLYLKRLSAVANQQANIAAALGGRDTSYLHMGPFGSYGNFHGLPPSGKLQGCLTTFQPSDVSSRTNSNLLGLPGLAPGMVQIIRPQNNTNNPMNDPSKFQQIVVPANQHANLLQGIPTSLELDQLQQKQNMIHEPNNHLSCVFSGASNNTFSSATSSSLFLQANQQQTKLRGLGNQSSVAIPSIGADRLEMCSGMSDHLPDPSRCNEIWQSAPSLSGYSANTLPIGVPYNNDSIASNNMGATLASTVPRINGLPLNISSNNILVTAQDSLVGPEIQCESSSLGGCSLLMPSGIGADRKYLNFRSAGNLNQKSEDPNQQNAIESNIAFSSHLTTTLPNQTLVNSVSDSQRLHNRIFNKKLDINMMSQLSFDNSFTTHPAKTDRSVINNRITFNEENMFGTSKMQGGFGNFDELMNAMIKQERDDIVFMDGDISADLFPLSTCM